MERLSNYAASSTEVLPEFLQVEAFSKLSNAIGKVNVSYFHLTFQRLNLVIEYFNYFSLIFYFYYAQLFPSGLLIKNYFQAD
jgi:hypothetical protein